MTAGPLVVQKFGGTSLADADGRASAVAKVRAVLDSGARVVLVVSAMGRRGASYATDTLLSLLGEREHDPAERDLLASCGEVISAVVMAHELRAAGVPARAYTGAEAGILTDGAFSGATILRVAPAHLVKALDEDVVPVVAGFQGAAPDGRVRTLARGGSDTTACALAAALHAERVEIHTDVDGVMTADPDTCGDVRVLDHVQYEELFQMARHGAKVVHPAAAEMAMEAGVPLLVRNTFSDAAGTLVAEAERLSAERLGRVATAVSDVPGLARVSVSLAAEHGEAAHMRAQTRVYRAMADAGVSLDMFSPCGDRLVFSLSEDDLPVALGTLDALGLACEVRDGLSKVTLVGAGMHGVPGVMARLAEALDAAGVPVLQTADSHSTISVLVDGARCSDAVRALHREFALGG